MTATNKFLPLLEKVEIEDAGSEGKALLRFENMVVFVPFAAPGDVCDIQITRKRKSFYEGRIEKIHTYSEMRTEPKCSHFGSCGGCKWQHIEYEKQLEYKQKQVKDNLLRIGKLDLPEIEPIIPSKKTYYYRNKLEFTFSNRKWLTDPTIDRSDEQKMKGLGFHMPGKFDRIIDINNCYLQDPLSNSIRLAVREYAIKQNLSFYNVKKWSGFLRNLIIRNTSTGEWMVIVVFNEKKTEKIKNLLQFIYDKFPQITSLIYVINNKRNPDISDQETKLFAGKPFIIEELEDLKFKIGPKSFFQTNTGQALRLYRTARDFADFKGNENVFDLYSGTGTIANFISRHIKKAVGIEYVQAAIDDAWENAKINNITNVSFHSGDILQIMDEEFIRDHGKPDVIITDPPRTGMHEKVVRKIMNISPDKIIYISCNPATQARDMSILKSKYHIVRIQPIDMFPQTHHVENVVLMVRNKT